MKHVHIEGTGKPLKVVAPVDYRDIFKKDIEYVVDSYWDETNHNTFGYGLRINGENGVEDFCLEKQDSQMQDLDWIVTERAPE